MIGSVRFQVLLIVALVLSAQLAESNRRRRRKKFARGAEPAITGDSASAGGPPLRSTAAANETTNEVDYLMLSTSWAPGACRARLVPNCPEEVPGEFLIHGLWPQGKSRKFLAYCNLVKFELAALSPLLGKLRAFWPSLNTNGTYEQFWAHEYNKHGSCILDHPKLGVMDSYFATTLKAFEQLNLSEAFWVNGLLPSDSYRLSAPYIVQLVSRTLGHKIMLECRKLDSGEILLTGLAACYDTSMRPIDCPHRKVACESERLVFTTTSR